MGLAPHRPGGVVERLLGEPEPLPLPAEFEQRPEGREPEVREVRAVLPVGGPHRGRRLEPAVPGEEPLGGEPAERPRRGGALVEVVGGEPGAERRKRGVEGRLGVLRLRRRGGRGAVRRPEGGLEGAEPGQRRRPDAGVGVRRGLVEEVPQPPVGDPGEFPRQVHPPQRVPVGPAGEEQEEALLVLAVVGGERPRPGLRIR